MVKIMGIIMGLLLVALQAYGADSDEKSPVPAQKHKYEPDSEEQRLVALDQSGRRLITMMADIGSNDDVQAKLEKGLPQGYIWNDNEYVKHFMTPLQSAIKHNSLSVVRYLVEQKAAVNVNQKLWSPLHQAASHGKSDVIKYLLSKGADIVHEGPCKTTPLYEAAYEGHTNVVLLLLEAKADPVKDDLRYKGFTLVDCIRFLQEVGYEFNLPAEFASKISQK